MRLDDKTIVVTGATGIAAAGALRFAELGARVFVISINEGEGRELAQAVGGEYAVADLRSEPETMTAFERATARSGPLHGLFAVAGASGRKYGDGPLHTIPKSGWDETIDANLTPSFLAGREFIRSAGDDRTTRSIVFVGSVLADSPSPRLFATHAYAAAKGALRSLTTTLAAYYAKDNIRVNLIAPGLVRTPMSERAYHDEETLAYAGSKQPLSAGFLAPDAVAASAAHLMSDGAEHVTGQVLAVDGGWTVTEADGDPER